MLMLGSCRTPDVKQGRGFSLVELVVVLTLMSLATAMVAPNLSNAYRNFQLRSELEEMLMAVESLGFRAFNQGTGIRIETISQAKELLNPPAGWSVELLAPIVVRANGVCEGGEIRFRREELEQRLLLEPPYCRVRDES